MKTNSHAGPIAVLVVIICTVGVITKVIKELCTNL